MLLDHIKQSSDIKKLKEDQYPELAQEIRQFLIEKISKTGGHLASNLGVVELTMALHLAFDLPKDKIVWDVGHQAYTHKLLSGRKAGFDDLRQFGGMSGFPKRKESPYDAFDTGHSSTSISAGLGLAQAREITEEDYSVISVIGDGALTGGNGNAVGKARLHQAQEHGASQQQAEREFSEMLHKTPAFHFCTMGAVPRMCFLMASSEVAAILLPES